MNYIEDVKEKKGIAKFFAFIGWFFKDTEGDPSMNRLLCFLFGIASILFGILMFTRSGNTKVIDHYEFWLSLTFAVIAILGKNIQKIVESAVDKIKFGK